MDRRSFLADLTRYTFLCAGIPNVWRVTSRPRLSADPFRLGVASGDPLADRCVIWTRLAPDPLQPMGGMDGVRAVVDWEVAHDEGFGRVVREGRHMAVPELGYSVHVDVDGLQPDRWYFYRFHLADGTSAVGRLRRAPAPGADTPLEMAVASCQHYEQGLFTAFEHMADEEIHLVAHLGDYIYETASNAGRVRAHHGPEIRTLDDYRARYAQYKWDPALQAAHARCPWIVTWDDHEVDNNYAGLSGEDRQEGEEQMHARRAAAYQAWWENQPVRVPRARAWADLEIRRSFRWGRTASMSVLDTRQHRSDQACGDGTRQVPCGDWNDPARTMLGDAQERWLMARLERDEARWQILAQQVMMAPLDWEEGPEVRTSMDQWSGYPAARERLLRAMAERVPGRAVVLSGDVHSNWVNELRSTFDRPDSAVVGTEFVATSISSSGDGAETNDAVQGAMRHNPHLRWHNDRRGYVRCSIGRDAWTTDYRTVDYVSRPGAPIRTASRWRLEAGGAGVEQIG